MVSKATPGCVQYAETRSHLQSPECFLDKSLNWTSLEKPVNKKGETHTHKREKETQQAQRRKREKQQCEREAENVSFELVLVNVCPQICTIYRSFACWSASEGHYKVSLCYLYFTCLFSTSLGICFINMNHTFVQYKLCHTQEQGKTQVDGDKETVLCTGSLLKCCLPWRFIQANEN